MVPLDLKLGRTELTNILRTGHSRIPVHEPGSPQDVVGLMLVKELVLLDPDDEVRLRRFDSEGVSLHSRLGLPDAVRNAVLSSLWSSMSSFG